MKPFSVSFDFSYLYPADPNHPVVCRNKQCGDLVRQDPKTGRWFITMGHAGFNSPVNNGSGYSESWHARGASYWYGRTH